MPTKQKSGLYRTKIKIGVDDQGRSVYKYVSGKTQKELEENKQNAISVYVNADLTPCDSLFGTYAISWFENHKKPFISVSQQSAYRSMLNKYALPEFGDRNLRAIQADELQCWLNQFSSSSKSQITMALSVMRGIFDAAEEACIIKHNPTSKLKRPVATPPNEKRVLTESETERILTTIRTHKDSLYLALLYYTGMRQGEVRGLQWGDIDFDAATIHVQRDIDDAAGSQPGALKSRAANRIIPISKELYTLLLQQRGLPGTYICHGTHADKPLSQASARRLWITLMIECGMAKRTLTCDEREDIREKYTTDISPHSLRHNFITRCWEAGLDPAITQKIVGHADYQTTINIYTHLNDTHLSNARSLLDNVFSPTKHSIARK